MPVIRNHLRACAGKLGPEFYWLLQAECPNEGGFWLTGKDKTIVGNGTGLVRPASEGEGVPV